MRSAASLRRGGCSTAAAPPRSRRSQGRSATWRRQRPRPCAGAPNPGSASTATAPHRGARRVRRTPRRLRPQRRRRAAGGRDARAGRRGPGTVDRGRDDPGRPDRVRRLLEAARSARHCLPTDPKAISEYARGFVVDRRSDPRRGTRPRRSASRRSTSRGDTAPPPQYAAFLALLLPAGGEIACAAQRRLRRRHGRTAGSPASTRPSRSCRAEIKGWYLHPYAKERKPGEGMAEVPRIRAEMASGQRQPDRLGDRLLRRRRRASTCLDTQRRRRGDPRRCGRGAAKRTDGRRSATTGPAGCGPLLVYARSDGGWAMQDAEGQLTAPGPDARGLRRPLRLSARRGASSSRRAVGEQPQQARRCCSRIAGLDEHAPPGQ